MQETYKLIVDYIYSKDIIKKINIEHRISQFDGYLTLRIFTKESRKEISIMIYEDMEYDYVLNMIKRAFSSYIEEVFL